MKKSEFETVGVLLDMSRNGVMTLAALKNYMTLMQKMGYNALFLYTEDTYEVDGEPYFGYMRGGYTKEELYELDAFASEHGIELIPAIQTLAHLATISRWNSFDMDTDFILMVDSERTYELIDRMFASLSSCIKSRRIHIGMDEAHMLGRGKHLDRYGYETVPTLMQRHLDRVLEIAKKYGYEPLIWSDMFFRPWNGGKYNLPKREMPEEYKSALPEGVIPVYWDYYRWQKSRYDDMFYNHAQLSDKTWFAGGAWMWGGFVPHNEYSLATFIPALESCREHGIKNIIVTEWGDNGAECSRYSVLPSLFYISEYIKGNTDDVSIKAKFKGLTGVDFDDFMLLDTPNNIAYNDSGRETTDYSVIARADYAKNPSKYMFYSDYFNGYLDYTVKLGEGEKYIEYAKKLRTVYKKNRKYRHLFDTASRLCDCMAIKYELGVKTRAAYKANDKAELLRLAKEDYTALEKKISLFLFAFEKQWMRENRPCGFEIQEYRMGGLIKRTESCKKRLIEYANGRIERIPELEVQILPYGGREPGMSIEFNHFIKSATVNPL